MDGLIVGMDLCGAYTQVSCLGRDKVWSFPTQICKKKQENLWFIGAKAHELMLSGKGVMADKLLSQARRERSVVIDGEMLKGRELLQKFLKLVLEQVQRECNNSRIQQLVITLPSIDSLIMDRLLYCADYLGVSRGRFHVISHGESFLYYVLNQKKEIWSSYVGLFTLSQNGLRYDEMKVQKGIRQTTVISDYENLDEHFDLNLLETDSGIRKADRMLCTFAERLLAKKLFSAVLLTGIGFEKQEWASDFMAVIFKRRKVYGESYLFAKGAAYRAMDYLHVSSEFPYVMICEGRLKASVSMEVMHKEKLTPLVIAAPGDTWYEVRSTLEFILNNQKELVFHIQHLDSRRKNEVTIPLDEFPSRPNRTTRVQMRVAFLDERTMVVIVQDKGFGELFPASNVVIRKEISL